MFVTRSFFLLGTTAIYEREIGAVVESITKAELGMLTKEKNDATRNQREEFQSSHDEGQFDEDFAHAAPSSQANQHGVRHTRPDADTVTDFLQPVPSAADYVLSHAQLQRAAYDRKVHQ